MDRLHRKNLQFDQLPENSVEPIASDEKESNVRVTLGKPAPEYGYDHAAAAERALKILPEILTERVQD